MMKILFLFLFFILLPSQLDSRVVSSYQIRILSRNKNYILGFFKHGVVVESWYLCVWHRDFPQHVIWTANRDSALSKPIGTLKIVHNYLVLVDEFDKPVWRTNVSSRSNRTQQLPIVELLNNGNFVWRDSNNGSILWQSFDFPTDSLVSGMKFGWDLKSSLNRSLRCWKSDGDPSSGDFTYGVETTSNGLTQSFIRKNGTPMFRSAPWKFGSDDVGTGGNVSNYAVFNITTTEEEATYYFSITNTSSFFSILQLRSGGKIRQTTWRRSPQGHWKLPTGYTLPHDSCGGYNKCGPNGICNSSKIPNCHCMLGFKPKDLDAWELKDNSLGCVRTTPLNSADDEFVELRTIKLPDTVEAIMDKGLKPKECKKKCLVDQNCTAYSPSRAGCIIWNTELKDLRAFILSGEDLFVRLPWDQIEKEANKDGKMQGTTIIILVTTFGVLLSCCIAICLFWRTRKKKATHIVSSPAPPIELQVVARATDYFSASNIIGRGGFGIIYKGTLLNGQVIAVKRLLKKSSHGKDGIRNELDLLIPLQHINLVQLRGYCFERNEIILVYEYLENSSLDNHIFDETRSCNLNWDKRFQIINGIARGLLYLHQDSRSRIIHRDLKPGNILLDKDMVPKISDFGLATLFERKDTEAEAKANEIVGTYGYMSPEYAKEGTYSTGSDVFSFGVVVLELISGKRNNNEERLVNYIWRSWMEGNGLEILDPVISSGFRANEILRCIQIGLLCVQDCVEARPAMPTVILMLTSESVEIGEPSEPGYVATFHQNLCSSSSVNQITPSIIEGR